MSTTIIKNIGRVLSGDIDQPVLDATCILVKDGMSEAVGDESIAAGITADQTIDAKGATVMPGLMDSHVHTTIGDCGGHAGRRDDDDQRGRVPYARPPERSGGREGHGAPGP